MRRCTTADACGRDKAASPAVGDQDARRPQVRPLATQAAEIASKISELKPDGGLQILVDLKNLAAADKAVFVQALRDNGLDPGGITILNP